MQEPRQDLTDAERREVQAVLDDHLVVSGLAPIGDETWAIYGSIPVDGEVLVAKFDNRSDAESALEQIAAAEQESVILNSSPNGGAFTRGHQENGPS